jgi:hypothetical protein
MGWFAWLCGAVVGVTFLASGGAKVASKAWPEQAAALGAPPWSVRATPWIELVLGGLLVARVGYPWTPVLAALLLVGFTALLVLNLLHDRRPPCACFGQLSVKPLSWSAVVRNGALFAAAAVAAQVG